MNGDSFLECDFAQLIGFHRERGALATMAVVRVDDAGRYGTVRVASDGRVTGFVEKTGAGAPGLINAGVYVFRREIFAHIPQGIGSLEKDVFPSILELGVHALEQRGMFIDIGTPEDYARAQELCGRLYDAASGGAAQVGSEKR
jgi:NDP-sugar pyrophosphorylase family protein